MTSTPKTIRNLIDMVGNNLGIDINSLDSIKNLNDIEMNRVIDDSKIKNIEALQNADKQFKVFEATYLNNLDTESNVKQNFIMLKKNLGELQIKIFMKKLEKAKNCDSILNVLIETLNNKLTTVNSVLTDDLKQTGGKINIDYHSKYIKYKNKYLQLAKTTN
jgi:hypothetical protein